MPRGTTYLASKHGCINLPPGPAAILLSVDDVHNIGSLPTYQQVSGSVPTVVTMILPSCEGPKPTKPGDLGNGATLVSKTYIYSNTC